jgi:hypothetical protein
MALQPRFGNGLSEKISSVYSISSEVHPGTGPKSPAIVVHVIHVIHVMYFGLSWFRLLSGTALYRVLCGRSSFPLIICPLPSVAQSIALHDTDDIWAVEHPTEFKIVPASVYTIYKILCGEPSSQRRVVGSFRANQGLVPKFVDDLNILVAK